MELVFARELAKYRDFTTNLADNFECVENPRQA